MKKTIITLGIAFSLSLFIVSCKSKPAETTVEHATETITNKVEEVKSEAQETANEVVSDIKVPTFADKSVNDFCGEFKTLMGEYAVAKGSGDATKEKALEAKFTAWAGKAGNIAGKLKPEEMKSFNDFIKMAGESMDKMSTAATNK